MSVVAANLSESSSFTDYFDFFNLPRQFQIDRSVLDRAYLTIQQEVHPDKFVNQDDQQKRRSLQMTTYANTAYQTLKQPLPRGFYLCQLAGLDPQLETNTAMPKAFLIQQMEWREELDDAKSDLSNLEALQQEVQAIQKEWLLQIEKAFDVALVPETALEKLRCALFLERFLEELDHRLSALI